MFGAALAGKAAQGLEESAGIQSRTLHSYQYRWRQEKDRLNANDVFVINEAGMVGSKQMNDVIQEAKKAGAKIVLVGDPNQLQPIATGNAFKAIADITNPAKITEIRRQNEGWKREASKDVAKLNQAVRKALINEGKLSNEQEYETSKGKKNSQLVIVFYSPKIIIILASKTARLALC